MEVSVHLDSKRISRLTSVTYRTVSAMIKFRSKPVPSIDRPDKRDRSGR